MANHPRKAEEAGWPVVHLTRRDPSRRPSDMSAFPNCVCGCQNEGEKYFPETSIQGLVQALEEIVGIYNDDDLTNSAAQDRTDEVARAALASFKQEVE